MNTKTPRRIAENGNDITIEGKEPDYIYLLLDEFNQKEMLEKNSELKKSRLTGYPFLLHIIKTLVIDKEPKGKNILEIGGGIEFGEDTVKYLRKLTDTVYADGTTEHHAWGIDERHGDELFQSGMWKDSWENLLDMGESRWDCIFHHTIGPILPDKNVKKELKSPRELAKITDKALKPGGYYIAFRRIDSDNIPIEEEVLEDYDYTDESFDFRYREGVMGEPYHVSIFQKPSKIDAIQEDTQDALELILPR